MLSFLLPFILLQNIPILFAQNVSATHFIRSFIENESKPTHLSYKLCWKKKQERWQNPESLRMRNPYPKRVVVPTPATIDHAITSILCKVMERVLNRDQVTLMKELSKKGVRSATKLEDSKYYAHGMMFLLDLDCPGSDLIIDYAAERNLLRSPYRWLVLSTSNSSSYDGMASILSDHNFLVDSDLVLAQKNEYGFKMIEMHKPSPKGPIQTFPRGYFNGALIDTRTHRSMFGRRRDVMGHPITMANVIQDNNSTQYHLPKENRLEPQHDSITKSGWSVAKVAFEMLNATPQYIFSHRWGYKQNGTWSGMINDLHTNKADLGTNCLITKSRLDVVTYTDMIAPFRVRFIFRQPPLSYVSNIFSLPFSTGVWVALVICVALSTASIYMASQWEVTFGSSPSQLDGSVGDALLLAMSAVSQQGCFMEPRKASGRIMLFALFTGLMALYAAYSANIVVLLQAPSSSIRTLTQLAHSKITLGANDVDYNHFVFNLYKDPVRLEIKKKVDPEKGRKQFYEINEGIERIREGLFAFHSIVEPVYRRIEETFLEMEKCDLVEVDFLNEFDPFTPVKKDSPYLELLRVVFKRIRESGIQAALVKRLQVPKPRCSEKGAAFSSVGLLDLKPVLILMLYGIALSILIFVVECIVYKINHQIQLHSTKQENSNKNQFPLQ